MCPGLSSPMRVTPKSRAKVTACAVGTVLVAMKEMCARMPIDMMSMGTRPLNKIAAQEIP